MSNSKLVSYTKLSPHCTKPRAGSIKGISIHTMAGPGSVEGCGEVFQARKASSHYGIGPDGRIGQYVLEKDRAWCCSHPVDHNVVTIEVSSIQSYQEPYQCTDAAYKALIDLCVDICQRNGIQKLIWKEGKQYCPAFTGNWQVCNMVPHRYTTDKGKSCPGGYLFGKYGEIARLVNTRLSGGVIAPVSVNYQVKVITGDDTLNCRIEARAGAEVVKKYPDGTILTITKEQDGWGYTCDGWVSLAYTKKLEDENMDIDKLIEEMTNDQAYAIMQKAQAHAAALPEPDWSEKEGHWKRATDAGIVDGTAPERPMKRCEVVAMLGRKGLV